MRKIRVLYEKKERAVYISHLDIMRTFQRVLTRAGIAVKHTEGFNPHPYISIALPLSLGYAGECEFLDMVVTDDMKAQEIKERMNATMPEGICVKSIYENGAPVRNIAYSEYEVILEYDGGRLDSVVKKVAELFKSDEIIVVKKSKRGEAETNIATMMKSVETVLDGEDLKIKAVLAAGNTSLNPEYIIKAIEKYLPDCKPDFAEITRKNVFSDDMSEFR